MKIAVVGSGISGLSSAYYLSKKHKVDLFEKEDRFGGHSHTLDIHYSEKEKVAVDIGFMVFNKHTYPNLINFFSENNIEIEKSDMSFSVTLKALILNIVVKDWQEFFLINKIYLIQNLLKCFLKL